MTTFIPQRVDGFPVYSVRNGSPIPQHRAQEIGEYLANMEKETPVTPQNVLEDARQKDSKLHEFFDWNDSTAADKWRLHHARCIVNGFEIVIVEIETEEEDKIRAWQSVNVEIEREDKEKEVIKTYVNTVRVLSEQELRKQAVKDAFMRLQTWRKQYQMYNEFRPVFESIDGVEEAISK